MLEPVGPVQLQAPGFPDCPPFLRAASGLAWLGDRLVAVQDDAAFAAFIKPPMLQAGVLPLIRGGLRTFSAEAGTKKFKPDLECVLNLGDHVVALGSGSKERRHRGFRIWLDRMEELDTRPLLEVMRTIPELHGEVLNVEAALFRDNALVLIHRANGLRRDGSPHFNVAAFLDGPRSRAFLDGTGGPPPLLRSQRLDLGNIHGLPLGITDATQDALGRTWLLCGAEDTSDATTDGKAVGAGVVMWGEDGTLHHAPLLLRDGTPVAAKCEGLAFHQASSALAWVVDDPDDTAIPSRLWTLTLEGAQHLR